VAGRFFRTFYGEGKWQQVVDALKPGDFIVIEFGHNDGGGIEDPKGQGDLPGIGDETQTVTRADGTTETMHTYGWNTRKFIRDVK
jgi:rhamnogalacturonan acetylesterase